jgi:hypothetical protein
MIKWNQKLKNKEFKKENMWLTEAGNAQREHKSAKRREMYNKNIA